MHLVFLGQQIRPQIFVVFEWAMKTEYQGRGTPHWHIAAWIVSFTLLNWLQGRTGTKVVSAFVRFLSLLFHAEIDVQIGNGRLNYISGYIAKDHDAVDVGLGEYVQKNACSSWLAAYRLLSQSTPCIPEAAIRLAQLSEFERSYTHVLVYPPQPVDMKEFEKRKTNFTTRMYGFYLQEQRTQLENGLPVCQNFLEWHRIREYDKETEGIKFRGGRHQQRLTQTPVVACHFWYELTDGYWGQFALMMLPHCTPEDILPREYPHLESMANFVGAIEYMKSWKWHADENVIKTANGMLFHTSALPLLVSLKGEIIPPGTQQREDAEVFDSDLDAFEYLVRLATRDLQYRGTIGRSCIRLDQTNEGR